MIETERLILRGWRVEDREPFIAVTNTPEVMEHLGGVEDPLRLGTSLERQQAIEAEHGFCFWLVERKADGALMGFCGLKPGPAGTPIEGQIEIGWRLGSAYWGQGYAREAAQACLDWAWANLDVDQVASITIPANTRSWGLMERLGMVRAPQDNFEHPNVPDGSPIKPHITYRIARPGKLG